MSQELFAGSEVYVGRDVGGWQHTIRDTDVARYEAGTEDRHPWYRDTSPFGGAVAPALLLHSEVYRDLSWYLPNLIGNLHARQEWELFHPFLVGTAVRTRSTVVERYVKRNREYIVNEVLVTDLDGRWLQRSRTHQSFLMDESSGGFVVDKDRERQPERRFAVGEGPGERLPGITRVVTLAMCDAFSGPVKNYHNDREMARALGFPDVVVQGMMSICFLSELMTRAFGIAWYCGGKLDVRLVNVLWGGEEVRVCGQITGCAPEGARTRTHVDVWCEKTDGTKTVVGSASAVRT
jgi:acyl dehydratase